MSLFLVVGIGALSVVAIAAGIVCLLIKRAPLVEECECEDCRRSRGELLEASEITDASQRPRIVHSQLHRRRSG